MDAAEGCASRGSECKNASVVSGSRETQRTCASEQSGVSETNTTDSVEASAGRGFQRIDASDVASCRGFQVTCESYEKCVSDRLSQVIAYWTMISRYSRSYTLEIISNVPVGLLYMSSFYGLLCEDTPHALLSLFMISGSDVDGNDLSPSDVQYWLGSTFKTDMVVDDLRTVVGRLTSLQDNEMFRVPSYVLQAFVSLLQGHQESGTNSDTSQIKPLERTRPVDEDLLKDIQNSESYGTITSMYTNFLSEKLLASLTFGMEMSRFSKSYFINTLLSDHVLCLSYFHAVSKADASACLLLFGLSESSDARVKHLFRVQDMASWLGNHFRLSFNDIESGKKFSEKLASSGLKVPDYYTNLSLILMKRLDAIRSSKPTENEDRTSGRGSLESLSQEVVSDEAEQKTGRPKRKSKSEGKSSAQGSDDHSSSKPLPTAQTECQEKEVSKEVLQQANNCGGENGEDVCNEATEEDISEPSGQALVERDDTSETPKENVPPVPEKAHRTLRKSKKTSSSGDVKESKSGTPTPNESKKSKPLSDKPKPSNESVPTNSDLSAAIQMVMQYNSSPEVDITTVTPRKTNVPSEKQTSPSTDKVGSPRTSDVQNGSPEVVKLTSSVTIQKVSKDNNASEDTSPKFDVSYRLRKLNSPKRNNSSSNKEAVKKYEDPQPLFPSKPALKTYSNSRKKAKIEKPSLEVKSSSKAEEKDKKKRVSYSDELTIFSLNEDESDGVSSQEAEELVVVPKISSTTLNANLPQVSESIFMPSCTPQLVPTSTPSSSTEPQPSTSCDQPSTSCDQPSTSSDQPSTSSDQPSTSSDQPKTSARIHHLRSDSIPKRHRISTRHHGNKLTVQASENSKVTTKTVTSTTPEQKPTPTTSGRTEAEERPRSPTPARRSSGKHPSGTSKASRPGPRSSKKDYGKKAGKDGDEMLGVPRNADEAEKMLALLMEDSSEALSQPKVSRGGPSCASPSSPVDSVTSTTPHRRTHSSKSRTPESSAKTQTPDKSSKPLPSTPVINLQPKKTKSKESPKKGTKASIEKICEALSASLTRPKDSSTERKRCGSDCLENKPSKHKSRHSASSASKNKENAKDQRKSSSSSRKTPKKEEKRRSVSAEVESTTVECTERTEATISISNKVDISSLRNATPNEKVPFKYKRKHSGSPSTIPIPSEHSPKPAEQMGIQSVSAQFQQFPPRLLQDESPVTSTIPQPAEVIGPKVMVEPVNGAPQPISLESEVRERQEFGGAEDIDDNMDLVNVTSGSEVVIYETIPNHPTLPDALDDAHPSSVVQQLPDSLTKDNSKRPLAENTANSQQQIEVITVPHDMVNTSCTSTFVVTNMSDDTSPRHSYSSVGQPESWPPGYKTLMTLPEPNDIPQGSQTIVIMDGPGVECPVTFSADTANEVLQQIEEATVVPMSMGNHEDDGQETNYVLIEDSDDKEQVLKNTLLAQKRKHLYIKEYKHDVETYEIAAEILGISHGTEVEYIEEVQETVEEVEISIPSQRLSNVNSPSFIPGIFTGKRNSSHPSSFHGSASTKRPKLNHSDQSLQGMNRQMTNGQKRARQPRKDVHSIPRVDQKPRRNCGKIITDAVLYNDLSQLKYLCELGIDLRKRYIYKQSLLHLACSKGHLQIICFLIEQGLPVDALDFKQQTPLCIAARAENFDVMQLLLDRGADVNARTDFGQTCLHYVAARGQHQVVKFLLERGADVNARDHDGMTPLNFASGNHHFATAKLIRCWNGRI